MINNKDNPGIFVILLASGMPAHLTPAQYTQSVDHGGVRVGPHNAVGVHQAIADVDYATQVLQVHLMNGAHVRREHVHVLERFGAPLP